MSSSVVSSTARVAETGSHAGVAVANSSYHWYRRADPGVCIADVASAADVTVRNPASLNRRPIESCDASNAGFPGSRQDRDMNVTTSIARAAAKSLANAL
jgi:hypothetical protein